MPTRLLPLLVCFLAACVADAPGPAEPDANVLRDGRASVRIVVAPDAPDGVVEAAGELANTLSQITGVTFDGPQTDPDGDENIVVAFGSGLLNQDPVISDGLHRDTYRITSKRKRRQWLVEVRAGSSVALQYGAYDLCERLGVRYFHPEQTFYPSNTSLQFPVPINAYESPDFPIRGIHQHTRHPIPFTDLIFQTPILVDGDEDEPVVADTKAYVSRYLQWLVRNRQNTLQWHLLRTVDLTAWQDSLAPFVEQAHRYGIRIGVVSSFIDPLENAHRLIADLKADHATQIRNSLDPVAALGVDFLVLRLGATPLSSPSKETLLGWIETAREHVAKISELQVNFWVHPRLDILDGDGGSLFHTASNSDSGVGLYAHATQHYGVSNPAPIWGAESAQRQRELLLNQEDKHALVYLPQSAGWHGYDNDVPVIMPLGSIVLSRDIAGTLAPANLQGLISDAGGAEWGYWLRELASMRFAWNRTLSPGAFLKWIRPLLGQYSAVVNAWGQLQEHYFIEVDPNLFFYLAGESAGDELTTPFGPSAKPRPPSLTQVLAMDSTQFQTWVDGDYARLTAMRDEHATLLEGINPMELPSTLKPEALVQNAQAEIDNALRLYLNRLNQVVSAYGAIYQTRKPVPDPELQGELVAAHVQAQRDANKEALSRIDKGKILYRYPAELGFYSGDRENRLTTYTAGYLDRTHRGDYFVRRGRELDVALAGPALWTKVPSSVFRMESAGVGIQSPPGPMATQFFGGLIPSLLVGVHEWPASPQAKGDITLAVDANRDGTPDPESQTRLKSGQLSANGVSVVFSLDQLSIPYVDSGAQVVGTLLLDQVNVTLEVQASGQPNQWVLGGLSGQIQVASLVELMVALSGQSLNSASARDVLQQFGAIADPSTEAIALALKFSKFTVVKMGDSLPD